MPTAATELVSVTITPTTTESGGEDIGGLVCSQSRRGCSQGAMDCNGDDCRNWTVAAVQGSPVKGLELIGSRPRQESMTGYKGLLN
jgi:hypothetical protein